MVVDLAILRLKYRQKSLKAIYVTGGKQLTVTQKTLNKSVYQRSIEYD